MIAFAAAIRLTRRVAKLPNVPRSRRLTAVLGAAAAMVWACLATACSGGSVPKLADPVESASLRFSYEHVSQPGYMNQAVEITNNGDRAVAPQLAYTPIDDSGSVVDGVTVRTAYGSDKGRVVVPRDYTVVDVLVFRGSGTHRVADVRVQVRKYDVVDHPTVDSDVGVEPLDSRGRVVDQHEVFDAVRLSNANTSPVTVCAVFLVHGDVKPDGTQQLQHIARVAGPTDLRAATSTQLRISAEARHANKRFAGRAAVSLKSYFCRASAAVAPV